MPLELLTIPRTMPTQSLSFHNFWNSSTKRLKGSVSRDFRPLFCSWFEPIWAHDKQSKVFLNSVSISPRYSISDLRGVQYTAEINSAVSNITQRLSSQCASHSGDDLCAHHKDGLSGGQHTEEMISEVYNLQQLTYKTEFCLAQNFFC